MEDKNMAREELREQDIEQVVGGAFRFYTNDAGQFKCKVDDVGTFYAKMDAFGAVAAYASDTSLTAQQVADWAIANGYFSGAPIY